MSNVPQEIEQSMLDISEERLQTEYIAASLDMITTPMSAGNLQLAAFCSVMDAFDRGVKRDEFALLLNDTLWFWDHIARVRFLIATHNLLMDPQSEQIQPIAIAESMKVMVVRAESRREKIMAFVKRMCAMPGRADKKH